MVVASRRGAGVWFLLVVGGILLTSVTADAQGASALLPFDSFIATSKGAYSGWISRMVQYATGIFWFWATFEFILNLGSKMLQGAPLLGALGGAFRLLIVQSLWFGALMLAPEWLLEVPKAFQIIGSSVANGSLSANGLVKPQTVGAAGLSAFESVSSQIAFSGRGFQAAILSFFILCLFAYIAIVQTLTILQGHFVVSAGAIMLGFAGSSWTRGQAVSYLSAVVGAGVQLMSMELLLGLAKGHMAAWQTDIQHESILDDSVTLGNALMGLLLVAALIKRLPEELAAMTRGGISSSLGGAGGTQAEGFAKQGVSHVGAGMTAAGVAAGAMVGDIAGKMGGGSGGGGEAAIQQNIAASSAASPSAGGGPAPSGKDGGGGSAGQPSGRPMSGADFDFGGGDDGGGGSDGGGGAFGDAGFGQGPGGE